MARKRKIISLELVIMMDNANIAAALMNVIRREPFQKTLKRQCKVKRQRLVTDNKTFESLDETDKTG